ncbi:tRNA uracil 4-sulfurtransferase ThiI [Paenibacillus nasutitermitis]|uniref:Probable tRNA sulfurtransferase n=1 Tax=Paenibacillus nasutitermitis TaxID=1652958 RepID=A0A917DUC8_9BACL|nr:tRNA uracil 4-sulfurtransferase ThiI [Paenibacillus nasutitermitis]GGD71238.1 putative tRNA sulfurtransferase [Paenibacillus nasutitermitis]
MIPDLILIRFGEHTIKGRNRGQFEKRMIQQIRTVLAPYSSASISRSYGRIYITLNGEPYAPIAGRLKDIFGIGSFSPVKRADNMLEAIQAVSLEVMLGLPAEPATFKVSVRRVEKSFPHDSQQMNHLVGAHVLRAMPGLKVNVREPQVELRVEIQPEGTYIFSEVIEAAGGYPFATNGKAMLLLSGGIDSPVAGYLSMRKGLEIEAVHFYSYPFTSEQAKDKVIELTRTLAQYSGSPIKLHLIPFTDIQTALAQAKQDNLIITLMRRSMLRITQQLAEEAVALGVVTGDSLGQVASQTLSSMNVIGRSMELPLLRPLIMMDKDDIIRVAKRIGTYETSILPYEDCCTLFLPKSPSTNPNLNVVRKVESFVPELEEMEARAVAGKQTMEIAPEYKLGAQASGEDSWF